MPIDPSIALSFRPPQLDNPSDVMSRSLSLAQMYQGQQLHNQQIQQNELKMKQERDAMADDQLYANAIGSNTTMGPDGNPVVNHSGVIGTFTKAGKGRLINTYTGNMLKQQKSDLEDHVKKLDLAVKQHDVAAQSLGQIASADPEKTAPEAYDSILQQARATVKQFGLSADDMGIPATMRNQDGTLNPEALGRVQNILASTMAWKDQATEHRAQVTAAQATAKAIQDLHDGKIKDLGEQQKLVTQTMAAAGPDNWEATYAMLAHSGVSPEVMKQIPVYYSDAARDQMGNANLTEDQRRTLALNREKAEKEKHSEDEAIAGLQSTDPEVVRKSRAFLDEKIRQKKAGAPVNIANSDEAKTMRELLAQQIAGGNLSKITDVVSMRGGERTLLMGRILQLNPKFSTGELNRQIKMQDNIENGQDGKQIQSFGTFLVHAGEAADTIQNLKNTNAAVLNHSLNWIRAKAKSSPEYRAVLAAFEPVKKEFESFLLNNRALYESDRKSSDAILNEDLPLADNMAAIKQMGNAAYARFGQLNSRYKKTMKRDIEDPFDDEAVAGAAKIGLRLTVGGSSVAPAQSPAASTSGGPTAGSIIDNHRFKGGDPNKQSNWETGHSEGGYWIKDGADKSKKENWVKQ